MVKLKRSEITSVSAPRAKITLDSDQLDLSYSSSPLLGEIGLILIVVVRVLAASGAELRLSSS
jgi:hypothetical protein